MSVLATLGAVLGFLVLVATFWRQVVRPLVRFAGTAERAAPALEIIARDFPMTTDGRSSLTVWQEKVNASLAGIANDTGDCKALLEAHVREHHE